MIDKLKIAISENDMEKARRILKKEVLEVNYPHKIFKDAIELATSYNVFEEHDNEKFIKDPSKWDMEYYEKLKSDLDKNFSKERFVKAYYVFRKVCEDGFSSDSGSNIELCDDYKDFSFGVKVGVGLALTAVTVGIGVVLIKRLRKK